MRRVRPWWAALIAATVVMASLMAPTEGAAYRIVQPQDPVDRNGDPDDPGQAAPQPGGKPNSEFTAVVAIQPIPGVILRLNVPVAQFMRLRMHRRTLH